jgi:hypothetical protein
MAGRKAKNVEFINCLKDLTGYTALGPFATVCGRRQSNMSKYLSGNLVPGKRVLKACLDRLFGSQVKALMEIVPVPKKKMDLPVRSGIYVIYDSAGNVLYIGKAKSFRAEVWQTLSRKIPVPVRFGPSLKKKHPKIKTLASHLSLYEIANPHLRHNLEAMLLRIFVNQTHNTNIGNLK